MSAKHLNQGQLAERWGVSEATLERWRSEGIGPVFLKLHGRVAYRIEDIEAYESESLRKSTSERVNAGGALAQHDECPDCAEMAALKNAWADTRLELANLRVYYEAACEDNERLRKALEALLKQCEKDSAHWDLFPDDMGYAMNQAAEALNPK